VKQSTLNHRIKHPLRFVLILLLSTASIATALAQGLGPAGPSPVTGHASVVATGPLEVIEDTGRWHVTRHAAEENGTVYESPAQGFVIAENTPVLVMANGVHGTRLAGGEAMSIPAETTFTVTTFGAPDTFLFMQLLPESGLQLSESSDRILTSASFSTEPGVFDASLIRDVLSEGEEGSLPQGNTPTAVFVLIGEVEVSDPRGTINLLQGDSAIFEGDIVIAAIADGSTYYAGFIGPELPEMATPIAATPEPTAVPATPEPTVEPTDEPVEEPEPELRTDIPEYLEIIGDPDEIDPALWQVDTDGDGLSDAIELLIGTDPNNSDTDGDGLSDGDEVYVHLTNPLNPDTDDDGITDGDEVNIYGTDPNNPDTDGDLFYDGGELIRGTDPLNPDTDGDGLLDGEEEYIYGTDPLNWDTDGDGVSDGDEVRNGTDPLDPDDF
jgi:hypothetical protein